jgi:hypothetical protein
MPNPRNLAQASEEIAAHLDKYPGDRGKGRGAGRDVADEPRVPKGNPDGGQWTAGSASSNPDGHPDRQSEHGTDRHPTWPRPYNMCDHGYQGKSCEGWVPGFLDDKPWDYMPTPEDLDRLSEGQKQFYARYYEAVANAAATLSLLQGAGNLYKGAIRWLLRKAGKEAAKEAPTFDDIAKAYRGATKNTARP